MSTKDTRQIEKSQVEEMGRIRNIVQKAQQESPVQIQNLQKGHVCNRHTVTRV